MSRNTNRRASGTRTAHVKANAEAPYPTLYRACSTR
jgi:hypothetical protein